MLVELSRPIGDQALLIIAELTLELQYDELHDADRRGENRLVAARAMNVKCLVGQRASRNTGDGR